MDKVYIEDYNTPLYKEATVYPIRGSPRIPLNKQEQEMVIRNAL